MKNKSTIGNVIYCLIIIGCLIIGDVFFANYIRTMEKYNDPDFHKRSQYSYTTTDLITGEELELWNKHIKKDTILYGSYNYIKTKFVPNGLYQYWVLDNDGNKAKIIHQYFNKISEIPDSKCMTYLPAAMPNGNYLLTVKTVSENGIITEQSLQTIICGPK